MQELLAQIAAYARGMWRYRWHALLLAWVISITGWAIVYALPDQYEARARIYVDTQSVLRPLLQGLTVESNVQTRVAVMTRALLSRPNLERVVRETDMDLRTSTPEEMESLLTWLKRTIKVQGGREVNNIYSITYTDRAPDMAQRVVQKLLDVLVEDTLGTARSDSAVAQRFLAEQISKYERQLSAAERRLAEFKKQHVGTMPGQQGDYYARLQAVMNDLEQARASLRTAINRRDELRKQLEGEEPVFGIVSPTGTFRTSATPLDTRIQRYQQELDELLLKYTARHPDVKAVKQIIARLEQRRKAQLGSIGPQQTADGQPTELNPVYQRLQIALNEADVEVAALQAQVEDRQNRVAELGQMVDTIPEVEAKLARLNRDYSVTKAQYESLVQRLESARLSEKAERTSDDVKFRIIDPPVVPLQAKGPHRALLLTAVLMIGLAAGVALAYLLNELRPVFSSFKALRDATGLPVLGIVSMRLMPRQRLRLRLELTSFVITTMLLGCAYGGALVLQEIGVRVAQSLLSMA
ncbi:MAG: XrtA system polysaccharide chain length determinant [Acidiferrobacterales bacterium]